MSTERFPSRPSQGRVLRKAGGPLPPLLFAVLLATLTFRQACAMAAQSSGADQPQPVRTAVSAPDIIVPAPPESPEAAFDAANKLYEQGKFAQAVAAYSKLIDERTVSAAIYFNLGNAYFKSGQLGKAIGAYRQAEMLNPRDPDIRANLRFAREQTQGPTLALGRWERWLHRLTVNEWVMLASAAVWILFLLLAAAQIRSSLRSALRNTMIVCAAITVLMSALAGVALYHSHNENTAVVVAPEAVVRNGPLEESQNAFTLYDGAEVRVLDHKDDWLMVTTDPRRTGWVKRDKLGLQPNG